MNGPGTHETRDFLDFRAIVLGLLVAAQPGPVGTSHPRIYVSGSQENKKSSEKVSTFFRAGTVIDYREQQFDIHSFL